MDLGSRLLPWSMAQPSNRHAWGFSMRRPQNVASNMGAALWPPLHRPEGIIQHPDRKGAHLALKDRLHCPGVQPGKRSDVINVEIAVFRDQCNPIGKDVLVEKCAVPRCSLDKGLSRVHFGHSLFRVIVPEGAEP